MIIKIENATVGVSPDGIEEVTQDIFIPYQAIMSSGTLEIYFKGTPGTTLVWPADIILPLHPNMYLSTTTTCWVYGAKTSPI